MRTICGATWAFYSRTSWSLRPGRRGCLARTGTGHGHTRATGMTQFSPGGVVRTASAMPETAARSPARLLLSTAMMAMGAYGCSAAMRLSVVIRVVKLLRSAASRSSSSRGERQWIAVPCRRTVPDTAMDRSSLRYRVALELDNFGIQLYTSSGRI